MAGHVLQVLILQFCSVCQKVMGCWESCVDVVVGHLRAMYPEQSKLASMNCVDDQVTFRTSITEKNSCQTEDPGTTYAAHTDVSDLLLSGLPAEA